MEDKVIILNVGGTRFETLRSTLMSVEKTRLSKLVGRNVYCADKRTFEYNEKSEFFFDRNAIIFESILDFYRNGELHLPKQCCGLAIKKELDFWGIAETSISACCKSDMSKAMEAIAWHTKMTAKFVPRGPNWYKTRPEHVSSTWKKIQYTAWMGIENSFTSIPALIYALIYSTVTIAKVLITIISTTKTFRVFYTDKEYVAMLSANTTNPKERLYYTSAVHPTLEHVDFACLIFFTVELISRFILYPSKRLFLRTFANVLDIVCLANGWIAYGLMSFFAEPETLKADMYLHKLVPLFLLLGLVTILRVCRLMLIAYQLPLMKVLVLSLFESYQVLLLMVGVIVIATLVYAPLIYLADFYSEVSFVNMPLACWWAIVTMTTVGYGDQVPDTILGYVVGSFCAITGLVLTALPIAVIGNNFNKLYAFVGDNDSELRRARVFRRRFTTHDIRMASTDV